MEELRRGVAEMIEYQRVSGSLVLAERKVRHLMMHLELGTLATWVP